jgi:hypothetical protein
MIMISRLTFALPVAILGCALFAGSASAQGRGAHPSAASVRSRSSLRIGERDNLSRPGRRRYLNEPGFFFPYYFPDGELDYGPAEQQAAPVQMLMPQPAQAAAPAASPIEPLLMEKQDGQWVRLPTGGEMLTDAPAAKSSAPPTSNAHPGITEPAEITPPVAPLPPAVIVFRDGHSEEVGRYTIQGDALYTKAEYGSAGKKISLAELDIPASLRINNERGTKFNLPSNPNEIVVRF